MIKYLVMGVKIYLNGILGKCIECNETVARLDTRFCANHIFEYGRDQRRYIIRKYLRGLGKVSKKVKPNYTITSKEYILKNFKLASNINEYTIDKHDLFVYDENSTIIGYKSPKIILKV